METLEVKKEWQGILDLEAIGKLSVAERYQMIEAIEQTIEAEQEKDIYYPDDPEDVRLAQEALDEYKADPSIGMPWDDFFEEETKRLNSIAHADNTGESPKRHTKGKQLV